MDVSQTDKNCLKVDLVGDKEYHIYVRETEYFDKFVKIISPEGVEVPNRVMAGKKQG